MASRAAWTGAITFGGFPINIEAHTLLKSKAGDSFTNLCPCHHAKISQVRTCTVTGDEVHFEDLVKGVTQGRGKNATYVPLQPEVIEAIGEGVGERSAVLEIEELPPAASVPFYLATGRYRIIPDPDVPGSAGPVEILWNGLIASDRALISRWSKRAGSKPVPMAMRADVYGLTAVDLPFVTDLKADAPEHKFTENAQAQAMFEQFATIQGYRTDDFVHANLVDDYAARKAELIAKAVAGEAIPVSAPAAAAQAAVPDLMAAMQAAMETAQAPAAKKPKAKAKSKTKAAA
jgi:non-homologous end joining protein Ku